MAAAASWLTPALVIALSAAPAPAQDTEYPPNPDPAAAARLRFAKTLRCGFDGIVGDTVIGPIDYENNTARSVGNTGATTMLAIPGMDGVSFLEITPSGAVVTITAYAWDEALPPRAIRINPDPFVAVMSRHTAVDGPSPSQLGGSCTVLQ